MTLRQAAAVYVVAAVLLTFPLAFSLTTRLGATEGPGDPYLNLWILGWGLRAWTFDPLAVFSGRVFDANIFHPAEGTLTYSDHFLLQSLALAPIYWATGNAVLCYNLLLLGSLALSGLAMHAFIRAVTGSTAAALLAGLAWASWPYRTAHLIHIQLQALYFLPLALLCLQRVLAGRRWRDAGALGLVAALQAIASVYYGLMTGIVLLVAGVAGAWATGQVRSTRLWTRLAAAGAVGLLLTAPVIVPYARTQQSEGFGRTLFEASHHAASAQAYTQVPPSNLLYGTTGVLAPRAPGPGERDRRNVEHQLFPGVMLLVLGAYGARRGWRSDARPLVLSALALVLTGGLLSLGPDGVRWAYAALHDHVYGFQAVRAPARFAVIAALGLCVLAAVGVRQASWGPRVIGLVAVLLMLEYANAPLSLAAAPPMRTDVGQWLAHEPAPGAVLYLPIGSDIESTPAMVQSLEHGRPLVNGYSGQRPAFYSSVVESLAVPGSSEALSTIRELDVRFVVSTSTLPGAGEAASPYVERTRLEGGVIYEVRWTPEALAALDAREDAPPPPPGPVPFAPGERAIYDVFWEGGPLDVAAGTVTLTARHTDEAGAQWQFELYAETADWVSAFFTARDRFTTTTDAALLPLVHHREIREGRRALDRSYKYDRTAGVVEAGGVTLPLASVHARDALSALYYVRTLPLDAPLAFPVSEAGRNQVVDVPAAVLEEIDRDGGRVPAWRLTPRLVRRIERRRPPAVIVWLAADEPRVPLRAVVDAGFGTIRLELREYRP